MERTDQALTRLSQGLRCALVEGAISWDEAERLEKLGLLRIQRIQRIGDPRSRFTLTPNGQAVREHLTAQGTSPREGRDA
jgi:hypothetical protein